MDWSPPGSSVLEISQARILEWISFLSPGDLRDLGIKPRPSTLADELFTTEPREKPILKAKSDVSSVTVVGHTSNNFQRANMNCHTTQQPPLLGIHTEETRIERDTCIPMFIAALFTKTRTWKQPRCPSADEWIRKLWYIYTMEEYSAIKKEHI